MNCFQVVAIKDHKAIHQSQLSFRRGDTIVVYETAATGWWRGELLDKRGLFPHTYVTYDKETLGADPLGTSQRQQPFPQPQSQSQSQQPTQHLQIKKSASPVGQVSPTLKELEDDFAEIDRIILAHSPVHSVSPQIPIPTTTTQHLQQQKKSTTPPQRNIYNTISSASISLSTSPHSHSASTSPPTRFNHNGVGGGGHGNSSPTPPMIAVQPSDLQRALNKTSTTPRSTTSPSGEQMEQHNHLRRELSGPSMSVSDEAEKEKTTRNGGARPLHGSGQAQSKRDEEDDHQESTKYMTLPNSSEYTKARKPLSSMFAQPTAGTRITLAQCNLDVPYYLTRATLSYVKQAMDELTIKTDDLILVYNSKDIDGDWWVGKLKSSFGIFPKNCVEIIKDISPPTASTTSPRKASASNSNTPLAMSPSLKQSGNSVVSNNSYNSVNSNNMFLRPTASSASSNGSHPVLSPLSSPQTSTPSLTSSHSPPQHNTSPPVTSSKPPASAPLPVVIAPSPPQPQPQPQSQTQIQIPNKPSMTDEEAAIAQKIKSTFSLFGNKDQMLEAIQGLAIKFVKQTNTLKQELDNERSLRLTSEQEIAKLRAQLALLQQHQR
ncbi:hypothetical protein SAMD00019534_038260 [Acytostelium subglobosum LB1]|uniref:hypothetical protein n=1 Tax=Acytostelium subglobosum LB1 TaxID=1410327 RepID=UPI0006449583|nr:hypothetical protein SAMD00019534_038260 [Acytostelium subglobosum LB1]GAM20651.1 hypothetical protein SAMD00019534_038260 [Acytostelium subglobosum LB1]|eukprot:XP_012760172.1 hypothetical protein SAMD00019534_038260 [Acytostelium subglobosum LB1]